MSIELKLGVKLDDDLQACVNANSKNFAVVNLCLNLQILRTLQKTTQSDEVTLDVVSSPVT